MATCADGLAGSAGCAARSCLSGNSVTAVEEALATGRSERKEAWVTLVSNDGFCMGAEVLIRTLRSNIVVPRDVVVLITPSVSARVRTTLCSVGATLRVVEPIHRIPRTVASSSLCTATLASSTTPPVPCAATDGANTAHVASWVDVGFSKLHVFGLTEYDKVVYLDADMVVLECIDELFDRPGGPNPAACPDVFPPDKFNAGLLVVEPSTATFTRLLAALHSDATLSGLSYDGGDTGFLNAQFPDWFTSEPAFRIPFGYNAQRTLHWMTFSKQPGYWNSISPLKIIHYSSNPKPWAPGAASKKGELELLWWQLYLGTHK